MPPGSWRQQIPLAASGAGTNPALDSAHWTPPALPMGVALTGIASWLTFQAAVVTNANGAIVGLTSFGQMIFSGPAVLVLFVGTLGLVFLISWRIDRLEPSTAFALFM